MRWYPNSILQDWATVVHVQCKVPRRFYFLRRRVCHVSLQNQQPLEYNIARSQSRLRVPSTANPSSTRLKQNTTNEVKSTLTTPPSNNHQSTTPQFSDQPRFVPSVSADSEPQTLQPPKTPQQEDVEKAAKGSFSSSFVGHFFCKS